MLRWTRRDTLKAAAVSGLVAAAGGARAQGRAIEVPNSSGTEPPRRQVPENACDAHFHILDAQFLPAGQNGPKGMTAVDYRKLQQRLGTSRSVIVQPKAHGTDPACLIDAIGRLGGTGRTRGISVAKPDVAEADLRRMHEGGVRGLRFSVWNPEDKVVTIDMIAPLAERVAPLGWHVQLHMLGDQIAENASLLRSLPCPIVFDHMGRLPPARGPDHPAFAVIRDLAKDGRAFVKLSGPYLNRSPGTKDDAEPTRIAQAFVAAVPERLVWGSDWPHVTERTEKPDDAALLDLLAVWASDPAARQRILVDNPAALYGFEA